jgi:hypothetical protein
MKLQTQQILINKTSSNIKKPLSIVDNGFFILQ